MRSRPRPAADGDLALRRVTQVLTAPRTGWVPPREVEEAVDEQEVAKDAVVLEDAVVLGDHDHSNGDSNGGPDDAKDRDSARTAQPRRDSKRTGPALSSWLPATLRSGRVDLSRGAVLGLLAVALVAALVTVVVLLRARPVEVQVDTPRVLSAGSPMPGASPPASSAGASTGPETEVVVAVAGKVVRPGLVRLPGGSRVDDAVRAAGGAAPGVDLGTLNLARKLLDGEQILVGIEPPPGPPVGPGGAGGPAPAGRPDGLLDLNAAAVGDFDALPGIGPVLAQRIVDWREQHGPFRSVDQLREVTGIGEAKYADLEAKVTV